MTFFVFPWIVNTAANCVSLWCSRLTNHPKVGTKWWIKDAWQIKGTKKNSKEPLSKTHYIINDHSPAAFLNIETHPHLSRRDSQVVDFKLDSEKCQSFSKFFFDHFRSKNTMNDKKFSQSKFRSTKSLVKKSFYVVSCNFRFENDININSKTQFWDFLPNFLYVSESFLIAPFETCTFLLEKSKTCFFLGIKFAINH